jgi:hypothetical protein
MASEGAICNVVCPCRNAASPMPVQSIRRHSVMTCSGCGMLVYLTTEAIQAQADEAERAWDDR